VKRGRPKANPNKGETAQPAKAKRTAPRKSKPEGEREPAAKAAPTRATGFKVAGCVMVAAQILRPGHFLFVAHDEASLRAAKPRCRLIEFRDGEWASLAEWPWAAVGLVVDGDLPTRVDVLGRDGQVASWTPEGLAEAHVDPGRSPGPLRGLRRIGGALWAYGMRRQVFRCDGITWTRMMQGLEPALDPSLSLKEERKARLADVGGIDAVAEHPAGGEIAVGMKGEIWRRADERWVRLASPTDAWLKDVTFDGGVAYACGQVGTILRDRGDGWQSLSYRGPTGLDFCSLAVHDGLLFVADGRSLRALRGDTLELVEFGVSEVVPCSRVIVGGGAIVSVAGQEVWTSLDGRSWRAVLG
jgi:hypothetical protein